MYFRIPSGTAESNFPQGTLNETILRFLTAARLWFDRRTRLLLYPKNFIFLPLPLSPLLSLPSLPSPISLTRETPVGFSIHAHNVCEDESPLFPLSFMCPTPHAHLLFTIDVKLITFISSSNHLTVQILRFNLHDR